MRFKNPCSWALLPLAFVACQSWAQPLVNVQATGIESAQVPVQPNVSWLREMVLQVLLVSPELAQAHAENNQSRTRWREAWAGVLPKIGLSGKLGQENQKLDFRENVYKDQRLIQLQLNQPLFDPVTSARTVLAGTQTSASDWSMLQVREQLMLRTLELYAELVRQSRLVELARGNLRLHRQYVGQMKDIARVDLGRAADLPVAQSRVSLAESVLTSRLAKLESARAQWRALASLPSPEENTTAALASVMRDLPEADVPLSLDDAVQAALTIHPLLQKALADALAAEQAIALAEASAKPRAWAELGGGNGNNYSGSFGSQRTWNAGINFQWNLSVADQYAQLAAKQGLRAAQDAVDVQVLRVRAAVETQWYELKAGQASLISYQNYAQQAQEVAESYGQQFRIGRRSLLDVLNAESELFTARSNAATTQIDVQLAQWRLASLRGVMAEELGL